MKQLPRMAVITLKYVEISKKQTDKTHSEQQSWHSQVVRYKLTEIVTKHQCAKFRVALWPDYFGKDHQSVIVSGPEGHQEYELYHVSDECVPYFEVTDQCLVINLTHSLKLILQRSWLVKNTYQIHLKI